MTPRRVAYTAWMHWTKVPGTMVRAVQDFTVLLRTLSDYKFMNYFYMDFTKIFLVLVGHG